MIPTLTAQQISFFAKNGFLELEELLTAAEWTALASTLSHHNPPSRDLWRSAPSLQTFLLSRKLTTLLFSLTAKPSLRLACDHYFPADFCLAKPTPLKDLFSIQGLVCALLFSLGPIHRPEKTAPLGMLPFPHIPGNALFVQPQLLLNWPPAGAPLYIAAYAISDSVYIHNPNDPAGTSLKQLGYGYGDRLRNETHPILKR